jgi:hypothetical protein
MVSEASEADLIERISPHRVRPWFLEVREIDLLRHEH